VAGASLVFSQDLEDAYIATPFDPKVEYLQEEMIRTLRRVSVGDQIGFEFGQGLDMVGHLVRDVIPLNLLHPANYFHFLIECLPSLLFLIQHDLVSANALLVTGHLHPNMALALNYVTQRAPLPILQLRSLQGVLCDRVLLPPPSWHATELLNGGVSDSTYDAEKVRFARDAFKPLWADRATTSPVKLFIRRLAIQRMLSNADEAERLAVAAGYQVIDPGGLDLYDQIRIFSSASHIVGPTGAWAANLLFARDDAKVTVLYPETCATEKNTWKALGEACGIEVDEVYCPITLRKRQPIHSDFRVPPEELAARLRA
jgi:capsular polysaccharide biosynthesis protein